MSLPPVYSASDASPSYAAQLSDGERRLEHITGTRIVEPPAQSTFVKREGSITLTLYEQEPGITIPLYGFGAIVKGEVKVDETDILSVDVKLQGRQSMYMEQGGHQNSVLWSDGQTLWRKEDGSSFPSSLAFNIPFPSTYTDQDLLTRALPPSYGRAIPRMHNLHVGNYQSITITVHKKRTITSWDNKKIMNLIIRYRPRSRPSRPIPEVPRPFFASSKAAPHDWHQAKTKMESKDNIFPEVECYFFLPSVQTFAITDTIPFYVQLRGPAGSLWKILGTEGMSNAQAAGPSSAGTPTPTENASASSKMAAVIRNPSSLLNSLPQSLSPRAKSEDKQPVIRVYLQRRLLAKFREQKVWQTYLLGEGKLTLAEGPSVSSDAVAAAMDWEGEVRCEEGLIKVGSFMTNNLQVRDFIILHLFPSKFEQSPFKEHLHQHPIQLVTDPYLGQINQSV